MGHSFFSRIRLMGHLTMLVAIGLILVNDTTLSRLEGAEPSSQERYLIIHADDAGMCHSENRGTIDSMEQGIVSSASIMVPCPWFMEIAKYAAAHPERDFGIHLTLNCEWENYQWSTVAPKDQVPSLLDPDGYMWDSVAEVAEHAKADEVEKELRAQIDRAKKYNIPISHLDTHMGAVLCRPDIVEIYVKLGLEYDLPILFLRSAAAEIAEEYPALADRAGQVIQMLDARKLPILDHIAQFYSGENETRRDAYLRTLRELKPGVSQLIIHCGYDDAELRAITNSASRRDADRQIFCDPEVIKLIQDENIKVIDWRQFRAMQ